MSDSVRFETTISKIMMPDDANLAGNVHGGELLKIMEEASLICAQRFLAKNSDAATDHSIRAALARVDTVSFKAPGKIGECMTANASITFTSSRSIEVLVDVWGESSSGDRRHTNSARYWYVPIKLLVKLPNTILGVVPVAKFTALSADEEAAGAARYAATKASRAQRDELIRATAADDLDTHARRCELSQLVLPSDCDNFNFLRGGILMKQMDNCAGLAAFRHCRSNVVTASVEAIDFRVPVRIGNMVRILAVPTFASARSLEIEVVVLAEDLLTGEVKRSVTAFFIFVALTNTGAVKDVPPITPQTPGDVARFQAGAARYEARKQRR